MKRLLILVGIVFGLSQTGFSQTNSWISGIELRAYPAGLIPSVMVGYVSTSQSELALSAGMNITNRRDWGEHENEEGQGFGGGLRYTYFFRTVDNDWFAGAVADVWRLAIDWEDDNGMRSGESKVTVFQPTARGGYRFALNPGLRLDLAVSLGAEINVATDGEDVGQGAILLFGAQLMF
ncbi:MAG: hypothetical protein ACRBF0_19370 [Calditrichia bacterium]